MRILYFDCSMGAAGDMLMAALLELHPAPEDFLQRLDRALGGMVHVSAERVKKSGIGATHMRVLAQGREEGHEETEPHRHRHHHHTSLKDVYALIEKLPAGEKTRQDALAVYQLIAGAEAQVHGEEPENIHFHELGTLDAFADIVGVCMLIGELAPDRICASPIHVGSGSVKCAHGILPVPAPATELILRGLPIYSTGIKGELCTPTGAALLRHFAGSFGPMPMMRLEKSGYGAGTKDFETANLLRAMLGEAEEGEERVLELRCNLDDMSPEAIGFALEELFRQGALDVYVSPILMKKSRPAQLLCCLCREEQRESMLRCLFKHTSTLGVREYSCRRSTLSREFRRQDTALGSVRVKTAQGWGVRREKVEYEDLAAIAREKGLSLKEVESLVFEGE